MTPQELLEIEQAMSPDPWDFDMAYGIRGEALNSCGERYSLANHLTSADGEGIVAARNRLKDLAELWAWAEPSFKDLNSNHGSRCAAHDGDGCSCWLKPLEEILTRLRGE